MGTRESACAQRAPDVWRRGGPAADAEPGPPARRPARLRTGSRLLSSVVMVSVGVLCRRRLGSRRCSRRAREHGAAY